MKYAVYTLKFLTPVHFGDSAGGGSLEKTSFICSADTYFSALCREASAASNELVGMLIEKFHSGRLQLSSLFPYYMQADNLQLYLPKPFWQTELATDDLHPFSVIIESMTNLKKIKKAAFVRVSRLQELITALNHKEFYEINTPVFAYKEMNTKVNSRLEESMPYFINNYHFVDNAGLYFIVGFEDEDDLAALEDLIKSLGYTGIGGKHSSGYGKYEFADDPIILYDENDGIYEDDTALVQLLNNSKGAFQLAVAPLLPSVDDITIVKMGVYKLLKRSGFVYADIDEKYIKKNNVYMLAEGSCFGRRIKGNMIAEKIDGVSHAVYRNGLGMFVGLNYEK